MSPDFDAYQTLQVDPYAEDIVLEAAYRVLARRYHPDGELPDEARMADINKAYDLLRTAVRRRKYDREHHLRPVGPGIGAAKPAHANGTAGGTLAARATSMANGAATAGATILDFGRYAGWTLKDLAKHDPDYLRWLARSSGGVRYRNLILQVLPETGEVVRAGY